MGHRRRVGKREQDVKRTDHMAQGGGARNVAALPHALPDLDLVTLSSGGNATSRTPLELSAISRIPLELRPPHAPPSSGPAGA
jgi:hypothetical protein